MEFTVLFGNENFPPMLANFVGTATAGQYTEITVPESMEVGVGTSTLPRIVNAVQISSTTGDIQVYAVHDDDKSSDGWLVLPVYHRLTIRTCPLTVTQRSPVLLMPVRDSLVTRSFLQQLVSMICFQYL